MLRGEEVEGEAECVWMREQCNFLPGGIASAVSPRPFFPERKPPALVSSATVFESVSRGEVNISRDALRILFRYVRKRVKYAKRRLVRLKRIKRNVEINVRRDSE